MGNFKIGDKVYLRPDSQWVNRNYVIMGKLGTVVDLLDVKKFGYQYEICFGEVGITYFYCDEDLCSISKPTPPTYTQSELDYISELEDEINRLNDLCSDYAKIVAEKDEEISELRSLAFNTM